MWHYFLNWTGPTNMSFLQQHGPHWSTGHIEAWCDNESDPEYRHDCITYPMPLVHHEDWDALDHWLQDLQTPFRWPLEQLLMTFETCHGSLRSTPVTSR